MSRILSVQGPSYFEKLRNLTQNVFSFPILSNICGILVGEIRRFIICHVLSAVSAGAGNLEAFIVCMAEAG